MVEAEAVVTLAVSDAEVVAPLCTETRLDCGGEILSGSGLLKTEFRLLWRTVVVRGVSGSPSGASDVRRA